MEVLSLEGIAALVAIVAGVVPAIVFGLRSRRRRENRRRVQQHLRDEKGLGYDQGQRTVTHLMAHLGMTESEVFEAVFRNPSIRRVTSVDERGRADCLMFEYDDVDDINRNRSRKGRF